jgi:Na+/H+-dicarboxylate symporter
MNDQVKNKRGISLSTQILIGLTFGLFVGIFFGEKASALAIVGRAYIGLIQMSILPYMVVSLMLGIGSLSYEKAGKLAITGGIVLVASWLLAFTIVFFYAPCFSRHRGRLFFQCQSG